MQKAPLKSWIIAASTVVVLGIATIAACFVTPEPEAAPMAGTVLELPDDVIGLRGEAQEVSEAEKLILPADTRFAKMAYSTGDEPFQVGCQIVLSGSDQRSIHRPEACLRGQGWTITNGGTVPVKLSDGSKMEVMKLVITRPIRVGDEERLLTSLYLYWFVSKDAVTAHHWQRIARTNLDLLLHNQTHRWAYIIVNAPVLKGFVPGGRSEEETLDLLKTFIGEAAPKFQRVGEGVAYPDET